MARRPNGVTADYKEAVSEIEAASLYTEPELAAPTKFISSGSTLFNCALSDDPHKGWPLGRICNLIGDSSSGKTFLALTMLAEAANDPALNDYKLIFDDAEAANTFNIRKLFGAKAASRIIPPSLRDGVPCYSNTIEEWYGNKWRLLKEGIPFIYVTDSMDSLSTNDELVRAKMYAKLSEGKVKAKKSDEDEEVAEVKGSYKVEKAKLLSEILRVLTTDISSSGSLSLIISQTRDNIDPMTSRFNKYTRTGGRALKFYSSLEIWLSHKKNIVHAASKRKIGDESIAKITKNKITGKQRSAEFPLFYDYGVDDISSCLEYLVEEGVLEMPKMTIMGMAHFGMDAPRDKLVQHIEQDHERIITLQNLVGTHWQAIEDSLKLNRRPKYD